MSQRTGWQLGACLTACVASLCRSTRDAAPTDSHRDATRDASSVVPEPGPHWTGDAIFSALSNGPWGQTQSLRAESELLISTHRTERGKLLLFRILPPNQRRSQYSFVAALLFHRVLAGSFYSWPQRDEDRKNRRRTRTAGRGSFATNWFAPKNTFLHCLTILETSNLLIGSH